MTSFKKHLISGALLAGALAVPALGLADDTTAAAPAAAPMATPMATPVATPTPLAWYQKITVGGYLDAYYQLNFNSPSIVGRSPQNRAFETTSNQFTLGGGELTLKQSDSASGTGYYVDLLMGNMAAAYNPTAYVQNDYYGDPSTHYSLAGGSNDYLSIGQAYVTQAFGNATITLGKFGTPVGYEVTYSPSDANFSRSLLFDNEPFFHTGVELSYALPAGFNILGWTDDGNSTDNATSEGMDYGAQVSYAGIKNLNLTGTWYLQQALNLGHTQYYYADSDNEYELNVLADTEWGNFIATYQASSTLSFAGEYLFKEYSLLGNPLYQEAVDNGIFPNINPIQQGYALYATYSPVNNLSISPRFEQWYNPEFGSTAFEDGIYALGEGGLDVITINLPGVGTPAVTDDYTLTLKYQMGPLAHILEYRADASDVPNVFTVNGKKPSQYNEVQQTLTYAMEYSF
jgi:Putative beta-barrel porin-2, OmpL-like. bbp2